MNDQDPYTLDYQSYAFESSSIVHADCFEWMGRIPKSSIHAIVTDPPYGVKEYDFDQIEKRANGNGGVWRIPPSFDGSNRAPLPRFTALNQKERTILYRFFLEWGTLSERVLLPGGHIFIASNAFLSQVVFSALIESGLEFRGELIRLVRTLVAAAEAQGISSIGVERFVDYFEMSKQAIPKLARLAVDTDTTQLNLLDLLET